MPLSIIRPGIAARDFQHPGRAVRSCGPADEFWEDGRNGLPSLSGSGHPVRGSVREADDGSGAIIPVEAESQGAVFGVWGGNGDGVTDSLSTDVEREGSRRAATLGGHGYWRRATNLQGGFPATRGPRTCPVEGCRGRVVTRAAMRVQFLHRHVRYTIIIMEEGNLPHPRCPRCDMMVPWRDKNEWHVNTAHCAKGAERKRRRLAEEKMQERAERGFQAYGRPLAKVTLFKYLGRVLTAADDNWPEVVGNLWKAWKSWEQMVRIVVREGAIPWVLGVFFKAVVQKVLLFGSEMWVMTPHMGRVLGSFHHRADRRITGRQPKQQGDRVWDYPPLETAMEEAGFEYMGAFVMKRNNTVAQYIAARLIMDLCDYMVSRPGAWVAKRWWEQEGLDLAGARSATTE